MPDARRADVVPIDVPIIRDEPPLVPDVPARDEGNEGAPNDAPTPDTPAPDVLPDAPRDVLSVPDAECTISSVPRGAAFDCAEWRGSTSGGDLIDGAAAYACCAGRCYASTGCTRDRTQGNSCGRDPPCDTAAGMRCCYELPLDEYHCVPRNTGRCNRFP